MKKRITSLALILFIMVTHILFLGTVFAEEIMVYDYTSFVGKWYHYKENGATDYAVEIHSVNENKIEFSIGNGAPTSGYFTAYIEDNQAKWMEVDNNGSTNYFTMSFYDDSIRILYLYEWNGKYDHWMTSKDTMPKKISANDAIIQMAPRYDYSSFIGNWGWAWSSLGIVGINGNRIEFWEGQDYMGDTTVAYIENNKAEWDMSFDGMTIHNIMKFYDDRILVTSIYNYGTADSYAVDAWMTSEDASPRKIYNCDCSIEINGEKMELEKPPIMIGERIYVPMREIFEALGADVYWDENEDATGFYSREITAIKDYTKLSLCSRESGYEKNCYEKWICDVAKLNSYEYNFSYIANEYQPVILDGCTYVSVRMVSEALKANVNWNEEKQIVSIKGEIGRYKKSPEEIALIDAFGADDAERILEENYRIGQAEGSPNFDEYGKFFLFYIEGRKTGEYLTVALYHDGTVREWKNGRIGNILDDPYWRK